MSFLSAIFEIRGDASGFESAIAKAKASANSFASHVGSAVTSKLAQLFAADRIIEWGHKLSEAAIKGTTDIAHFAEITGMSVEQIQQLRRATTNLGLGLEDINGALRKYAGLRKKAGEGDAEALRLLQRYGITYEEVQNAAESNFDQMMRLKGSGPAGAMNPREQAEMFELFGRSGLKIAAIQREMADAKREDTDETEEQIKQVEKLERTWNRFKLGMLSIAGKEVAAFGEAWDFWQRWLADPAHWTRGTEGRGEPDPRAWKEIGPPRPSRRSTEPAFRDIEGEEALRKREMESAKQALANQEAADEQYLKEHPNREQHKAYLKMRLGWIDVQEGEMGHDSFDEIERQKIIGERMKLRGQLFDLNQVHGLSAPVDALRRVGLSTGPGGGNPLVELSRQQVGFLRELVAIARAQNNALPVNTTGA